MTRFKAGIIACSLIGIGLIVLTFIVSSLLTFLYKVFVIGLEPFPWHNFLGTWGALFVLSLIPTYLKFK